jgi:hypothetical protein
VSGQRGDAGRGLSGVEPRFSGRYRLGDVAALQWHPHVEDCLESGDVRRIDPDEAGERGVGG